MQCLGARVAGKNATEAGNARAKAEPDVALSQQHLKRLREDQAARGQGFERTRLREDNVMLKEAHFSRKLGWEGVVCAILGLPEGSAGGASYVPS